MKSIFISHSSADEPIVKSLIDDLLVGALSVRITDIFCTTTDGAKIDSGEDWRNCIQSALKNSKLTILIITPNYKESEVCICEMGAAWVTSSKTIPYVVEPISYSSVGIIQQPKQIEKLLEETSLDRLKDIVQSELKIDNKEIKSDRWTVKKKEFLLKAKNHIKKNPFQEALSRDEFLKCISEKNDLNQSLDSVILEKIELEQLIDELKDAKDPAEVKKIEKKYINTDLLNQFQNLCKDISKQLGNLSSIIRGSAYISYSQKDLRIRYSGWGEEIDEAISKDLITSDLDADWSTSRFMENLYDKLNELETFIRENEGHEDFYNSYIEEYDSALSISNKDFWEEVFDLPVDIS